MTPDDAKNKRIAEARGEEGWEKCPNHGCAGGALVPLSVEDDSVPCPTCHGKGKVPRQFEDPAITLELWDWFCQWVNMVPKERLVFLQKVRRAFCHWLESQDGDRTIFAPRFRDLIAEALEEKKHASQT